MAVMSILLITSGLYAVWESGKHDRRNNDE